MTFEGSLLASDVCSRYRDRMGSRLREVVDVNDEEDEYDGGDMGDGRYNHLVAIASSEPRLKVWGKPKGGEEWEEVMDRGLGDTPSHLHFFSSSLILLGYQGGRIDQFEIESTTSSTTTTKIDTRARARAISLKVDNTGVTQHWKLGTFRLDVQPDGRR